MVFYILKFSACLLVLLAFYKLFLEKESMHKFKRFYLISTILAALIIPLVTFTKVIVEPLKNVMHSEIVTLPTDTAVSNFTWLDLIPNIIWGLYILGAVVFSWKFIRNLWEIRLKIKNNPKYKQSHFTNVLLKGLKVPHTFLNFIFLNKTNFENNEIPEVVFLHEQAHAKQKHTIDILFIEVLQILFWFNPLLIWLKRHIKLNHEHLADQAVLNKGVSPITYQEILLAFSVQKQNLPLSNAINYSSLKKRLTIMKTHTSKQKIWLRSLLLLPLLAILTYGFSDTKEIVKMQSEAIGLDTNPIELYLNDDGQLYYKSKAVNIEELGNLIELKDDMEFTLIAHKDASYKKFLVINKELTKYLGNQGLKRYSVCSSQQDFDITNDLLLKNQAQKEPTKEEIAAYNAWAKKKKIEFNKIPESKKWLGHPTIVNDKTFRYYHSIYERMTPQQQKNAVSLPEAVLLPESPITQNIIDTGKVVRIDKIQQNPVTKEEKEAYNSWAKKINTAITLAEKTKGTNSLKHYPIVKLKDGEKYKRIYGRMTDKERNSAESFPNLAQIPPPPASKKEWKKVKETGSPKQQKSKISNQAPKPVKIKVIKGKAVPPPPPIPADASDEEKRRYKKVIDDYHKKHPKTVKGKFVKSSGKLKEQRLPPPPPPPVSMEDLAKKGAVFYLDGKKIDAKKAVKLSKTLKPKHIEYRIINGKESVYLSTKPKPRKKKKS